MAVNPRLIIQVISETATTEKGRKALLIAVIAPLAIILMALIVFVGLITGLISIVQNADLSYHWQYVRSSLSELFDGIKNDINIDVKNEVYDFMPDFSINLSKAAIGTNFDGSFLVLYDENENEKAQAVMKECADELRSLKTKSDFNTFIERYPESELEYTDITKIEFTDDNGIDNLNKYEENVRTFLYSCAAETLPQYEYTFKEISIDGKPAEVQTLTVTDSAGNMQTVEYTCIGGGEIDIPQFLAMYNVYQMRDFLLSNKYNGESFEAYFEEVMERIPETEDVAEAYFEASWRDVIDGRSAVGINAFQVSDLCNMIEEANMDGAVKIEMERTSDKLSILLETAGTDVWAEVFGITEELEKYVDETQRAIELALEDAGIPEEQYTLSLNNMVQMALFVYFEGFFQLPVSGAELASGTNGILSQFGEASSLHEYNYGSVANDYGAAERGITLQLENADTAIHADLLNCDETVITMAYIFDVWDAEEHELDRQHMPSAIENPANKIYNRSAVTIAYIIDTMRFEEMYGFPFPRINNFDPDGGYVTLLLEFTCLDRLNGITEYDKGRMLEDIFGTRDDVIIGYCHNGYYDKEYDWKGDSMAYYHNLSSDECVPHVGIKTFFLAGASEPEKADEHSATYRGPSMMNENTTTVMKVNPRLWFKGFRTAISEELLATLDTAVS